MDLSGNTVLVTGGATGIGRAIAERFLAAGSRVIVCGRRADRLSELAAARPGIETFVADVATAREREALAARVQQDFPSLNVLVNNAGIQRRTRLLAETANWAERQSEIAINFEAPVHLCSLLMPQLTQHSPSAILNVSSGLAFVPAVFAPVYAATKAALHSFTMSLRFELSQTPTRVIEIVPPAVNTDLGGVGLHTSGAPLDEFADAVMARVAAGELEIGYGFSEVSRRASREQLDATFERMSTQLT
jgi:uncharacterized oxidoreductase